MIAGGCQEPRRWWRELSLVWGDPGRGGEAQMGGICLAGGMGVLVVSRGPVA
jgi:hypothetical protein